MKFLRTLTVAAALSIAAAALPALAVPAPQDEHHDQNTRNDEHQDYTNNSFYQLGNREGYQDHQHGKKKTHHHKYSKDEDRAAYQNGYDQGWNGHQYTKDNHRNDENNPR